MQVKKDNDKFNKFLFYSLVFREKPYKIISDVQMIYGMCMLG